MYEKIGLRCSDVSDQLMGFDLDLLDSSLDFTRTAMIQMENTLLNLDGTYDDDSDSDDVSLTTDDSNQEWSSQISTSTHHLTGKRKSTNGQPRQLPGPKSRRRLEDMTPQEIARRQRRRERNKAAAARCRQRRLDVTNQLLAETQQLEAEGQRLEREIENLRKQRDQLEFVLEAHQPMCLGELANNMAAQFATTTGGAVISMNTMPIATRPSSLPIACSMVPSASSSSSAMFGLDAFDLGSTGVTPVVSASGFNLFMGAESDYVMSPTTLLGSPSFSL